MSWKDIPLPPRVAKRPRGGKPGYPVPYVAQSMPEKSAISMRRGESEDGLLRGVLLVSHGGWKRGQPLDATAGEPYDFGDMNEERQRDCMLTPRCQVCAIELPKDGPWWHSAGSPEHVLKAGERGVAAETIVFREPNLCQSCLTYALQICPGLKRGQRGDGEVTVYRVWRRAFALEVLDVTPVRFRVAPVRKFMTNFTEARAHSAAVRDIDGHQRIAWDGESELWGCYNVAALATDWEAWTWRQWLEGAGKLEPPKYPRRRVGGRIVQS
jgi:hypothetical protein